MKSLRTCCACTCKDYVCRHYSQNGTAILAQACSSREKKKIETRPPSPEDGRSWGSRYITSTTSRCSCSPARGHWWWGSPCPTPSNTGWRWRTIPPLKIWLIAGILPRQQGNMDLRRCASKIGENGFTAETSDYAAMKLFQVVRASIRTCSRVTQQP